MRRLAALTAAAVFAFAAALSAQEAPKAPASPEAYVPADAVLYVHFQGLTKAAETFRQTDLCRILHEPEVQEFGAELSRFMGELMKEKAEESPVQWADIQLLYNSEISFALLDFRGAIPSMALIVRGGDKVGDLSKILDRVIDKATGGHPEAVAEVQLDGIRVKQVGPFAVATVSGDIIIASGQETMRRVARTLGGDEESLLKNARFTAAAKKFGAEKEFLTAYFNTERFAALMKDMKNGDIEDFERAWKVAGLTDVDYARLAIAPDAPGVKVSLYVHAPKGKTGLFRILPSKPLDEKSALAAVPATAKDFFVARWSPADVYDGIAEMLALAGEDKDFEAAVGDFNQAAGFDLRKDLLASLGDEISVDSAGPGFFFFPELYASVGVKDEKKLVSCIERLIEVASQAGQKNGRDRFSLDTERIAYKGNTINAVKIVGLPIPASPSWCITRGGRLLVAATPQTLKKALDARAAVKQSMADSQAWKALRPHVAANASVLAYGDVKEGFDGLYGGLATMLIQMTNGIPDVPKHSLGTKFPTSTVITPYLSPSVMTVSHDGEGFLFESYGTFGGGMMPGGSTSVASAGVMAGFLLPALAKSQEAARRASCMNNIRQIGLAMFQYAGDHDDKFPASFGVLLHDGYLTTPKVFFCPSARGAYKFPADMDFKNTKVEDIDKALAPILSYVKVPGLNHDADAEAVILYEKDGAHGREGRNVFFNDGHVKWYSEFGFKQLMKEQQK